MKTAFVTTAASFLAQKNENPTTLCMSVDSSSSGEMDFSSRRSILRKMASTVAVAAVGSTHGWIANGHPRSCNCSHCEGSDTLAQQNGSRIRLGPMPAYAYERDVGDSGRSADTYAQNLQVRKSLPLKKDLFFLRV